MPFFSLKKNVSLHTYIPPRPFPRQLPYRSVSSLHLKTPLRTDLLFALQRAPHPLTRLLSLALLHDLPNGYHRNINRPPPNHNHFPLRNNSPDLSIHGPHVVWTFYPRLFSARTLPHPDRRYRHFPDMVMQFLRLLLPQASCSFSEVLYTTLHATIYMSSQRGIYLQPSC